MFVSQTPRDNSWEEAVRSDENESLQNTPGPVTTRRDYAERLSAAFYLEIQSEHFDLEIQSKHFGNGRLLSMEGSSVELRIANLLKEYKAGNLNVRALEQEFELISHFSDVLRQDSTTRNAHQRFEGER
jgi:hypothetical protein